MRAMLILTLILGLLLIMGCTPQHELNLVVDGEGEVSGAGRYEEGASINLAATPKEGFSFVGWEIEGEVISEKEDFTYTMPAESITIEAHFEKLYSLNVISTDPSRGTVSGEGEYVSGEEVEIIAHPEEGFEFWCWKVEGEAISEEEIFTYVMPSSHATIEGFFQREPLLSIDHFDEDSGWTLNQRYGKTWFEDGRVFLSWTDDDSSLAEAYYEEELEDFILEVDVEYIDEDSAGKIGHAQQIGFRRDTDAFEGYRLIITTCGHFWLVMDNEEEGIIRLHEPTQSQHIVEKGKNRVRIEAVGEEMRFFVNNQLLIEITDDVIEKGSIVFFVGFGGSKVEYAESAFSNLTIREP